jgi:NADPH:quinone reductase-like Zn-dependent oxidoreductase
MVRALGAHNVVDYTKEDFTEKGERYDVIFNAVGKAKAHLHCNQALAPGGKPITVDDGSPRLLAEDLIGLNQLVEQGQLKAVIDRSYTLEQMAEAHRYVDTGRKKGNVIIHVVPQR